MDFRLSDEEERFQREMFERSVLDPLTGLYNRAYFSEQVGLVAASARCRGQGLAVVMLDIDRFKRINDTLGHQAGDDLLREVARRMRRVLKRNDVLVRLAGDEFIVLAHDLHGTRDAEAIVGRLGATAREPISIGDRDVRDHRIAFDGKADGLRRVGEKRRLERNGFRVRGGVFGCEGRFPPKQKSERRNHSCRQDGQQRKEKFLSHGAHRARTQSSQSQNTKHWSVNPVSELCALCGQGLEDLANRHIQFSSRSYQLNFMNSEVATRSAAISSTCQTTMFVTESFATWPHSARGRRSGTFSHHRPRARQGSPSSSDSARKLSGGIWPTASFMIGQFRPQNSVSSASTQSWRAARPEAGEASGEEVATMADERVIDPFSAEVQCP